MFSQTIYISSATKKGPGILINKKTGNYVQLHQKERLLQCSDGSSEQVLVLPLTGNDFNDKVFFIKGTAQEIKAAMKKCSKTATFQLISNEMFR